MKTAFDILSDYQLIDLDHRDAQFVRAALIDEIDKAIAAAVQAERETMQSVAPSILGVNTEDVLGWNVMTKEEKRMWYAGYLCGVADYTEAIRARSGQEEQAK